MQFCTTVINQAYHVINKVYHKNVLRKDKIFDIVSNVVTQKCSNVALKLPFEILLYKKVAKILKNAIQKSKQKTNYTVSLSRYWWDVMLKNKQKQKMI